MASFKTIKGMSLSVCPGPVIKKLILLYGFHELAKPLNVPLNGGAINIKRGQENAENT